MTRLGLTVLVVAVACAFVAAAGPVTRRAFRVPVASLTSAASVRRTLAAATADNAEAVIVPLSITSRVPTFDGVAELLREARESGLRTYLSVDVTTAVAADELPASREHVIYQHPEWLMIARELAPELLNVDPKSPAYLGSIARWARAHSDRVSGLAVSPLDPAAAAYLASAVTAAVEKYSVDGVYLDNVVFPGPDFDYSRHTMEVFRAQMRAELSVSERTRLDAVEAIDPFAYADELPDEWNRFREAALTGLVERIHASLAARALSITADVGADADASLHDHFQDWRSWLDRGLVDSVGYRGTPPTTVVLSDDGTQPPDPPARRVSSTGTEGGTR